MSDNCAICLSELLRESSESLPCKHAFHLGCLEILFRTFRDDYYPGERANLKPTCPLCRSSVSTPEPPKTKTSVEIESSRDSQQQPSPEAEEGSNTRSLVEPLKIIGVWGRGRNIHYRLRWSDGTVTLIGTLECELRAPILLEDYRREQRHRATAQFRLNQKLGSTPRIPERGRGRGCGRKG